MSLLYPELRLTRPPKLEHPASWIVNLSRAFAEESDVDLHIITSAAGLRESQTVVKWGITFHVVRYSFPLTQRGFPNYLRLDTLTWYAGLRRRIGRVLRQLNPDIIHVHGTESGYGLAASTTSIPTIISIQGIICRCAAISPCVFYRLQSPIERYLIRNTRYFGSRTDWANEFIRSHNKSAVIYDLPEAVYPSYFLNKISPKPNGRILMVGSLLPRKGIEEAIRAMKIVLSAAPEARLLVVGDGDPEYIRTLAAQAGALGVEERIEWCGRKTADEIVGLHAISCALIHPSYIDNSPNSVVEGMASGLPVIASDVGGISSLIKNDVTGLLVQVGNHEQLAGAILSLLRSEQLRLRIATNARQLAITRNLPNIAMSATHKAYDDMLVRERVRR